MRFWQYLGVLLKPVLINLNWFRQFLAKWYVWALGLLSVILAPFNWIFGWLLSLIAWLNLKLQDLTDIVNAIWGALDDSYPAVANILAIANAILPVDELFKAFAVLITLWAIALIYRFTKSWIPNWMSGS